MPNRHIVRHLTNALKTDELHLSRKPVPCPPFGLIAHIADILRHFGINWSNFGQMLR
jgi:hypothetical protein